jgi:hypothetical protein
VLDREVRQRADLVGVVAEQFLDLGPGSFDLRLGLNANVATCVVRKPALRMMETLHTTRGH